MNSEPTCGCAGAGGGGCSGGGDASLGTGARERRWADADGEHIDVRGLPPPQPMVAILRLLAGIDAGAASRTVIAHLDRDPLMLYPELVQRGWRARLLPQAADEGVRLRLQRESAPT
ncbi:MAG: hypothetical protein LKCHEGNO_00031 [Burkholderiaceae bacterium]|nr:hypothetical protein [Burkholderiaceae bacterium]